jgi:hypothetical protein
MDFPLRATRFDGGRDNYCSLKRPYQVHKREESSECDRLMVAVGLDLLSLRAPFSSPSSVGPEGADIVVHNFF